MTDDQGGELHREMKKRWREARSQNIKYFGKTSNERTKEKTKEE